MTAPSALDLWFLADHAHDLAEARFVGTARPWRQGVEDTDPERAEARAALAIQERADRSHLAIGEHPAPMHVSLLDRLVELVAKADEMAETVAQLAGVERMPPASSSFADPAPYLRHAAMHLKGAWEADPDTVQTVLADAAVLRAKVSADLGLVVDGQQVPGLCPWCGGGLAGRQTLRVRMVKPAPTLAPVPAAVCESDVCEPPEGKVGVWHRARPAWPLDTEGDWLAKCIKHVALGGPTCGAPRPPREEEQEDDGPFLCGEPLLPTGRVGRPRAYCSAQCRRRADAERKARERELEQREAS